MSKSSKLLLGKAGLTLVVLAFAITLPLQKVSADFVYFFENMPTSHGVRGLIVELEVKHAQGIVITEMGTTVSNSGIGERSYGLYYFAGAHDADVGGTPAHQANIWSQIGFVPLAAYAGVTFLNFDLNQGDAAGGSLTLGQGRYTFMFYSEANTEGVGNNGLRATAGTGSPGDLLPPLDPAAGAFVDLLVVNTKQGLNSSMSTTNPIRSPGIFEMTFTPVPEPGSGILLTGLLLTGICFSRRRV